MTRRSDIRLGAFVLAALGVHGVVLWFVKIPVDSPETDSRFPVLKIAIEAPSAPHPLDAKPVPQATSRETKPDQPGEPEPGPGDREADPSGTADTSEVVDSLPAIDPDVLLRNMEPAERAPEPGFPVKPETHRIFRPQQLVEVREPAGPWSRHIWRRSAVTGETRFDSVDGRRVWIRRYDNGDVRICERSPDDLMNPWDDHLPYLCER